MTLEQLPSRLYTRFAQIGQALSDPTRLRALNLLAQTERSVEELSGMLGHSAANTSAHLKVLQRANLVRSEKKVEKPIPPGSAPERLQTKLPAPAPPVAVSVVS